MQNSSLERFFEKNRLLNLEEIIDGSCKPPSFSFAGALELIRGARRDPGDFYMRLPEQGPPLFCYYKGFVLIEAEQLDQAMLEQIQAAEGELNRVVASRDFRRFFELIDPRLKLELLVEVFDFIPDSEKYPLVEEISAGLPGGFQALPEDFQQKARRYRGASSDRPLSDENNLVYIYRGQSAGDKGPGEGLSWTTDINVAVLYALNGGQAGSVYQAAVHSGDIINYVTENREKEVLVDPACLQNVEQVRLCDLAGFVPELEEAGVMELYHHYSDSLRRAWFVNPDGIHAISHTRRVLLLALMIAYLEKLGDQDTRILAEAAMYHDIGRTTDGYDSVHGFSSHKKAVDLNLFSVKSGEDMEILRFVIENHSAPDMAVFKVIKQYHFKDEERALYLYHLFKDADGLDRVRINDFSPEYLRGAHSFRLIMIAHQLYRAGEYERLDDFFFKPGGGCCGGS